MKPLKLPGKCFGHGARNMSPIQLELYLQPLRTPPAGHSNVCRGTFASQEEGPELDSAIWLRSLRVLTLICKCDPFSSKTNKFLISQVRKHLVFSTIKLLMWPTVAQFLLARFPVGLLFIYLEQRGKHLVRIKWLWCRCLHFCSIKNILYSYKFVTVAPSLFIQCKQKRRNMKAFYRFSTAAVKIIIMIIIHFFLAGIIKYPV